MRLAFILLLFATAAHGQIIINPYWYVSAGLSLAYANEKSIDFDGAGSEYVDFGDSDDFSFGDGSNDSPFSVSAWVFNENTSSNKKLIVKRDGVGNREWLFYNSGSNFYWLIYDESASQQAYVSTTTPATLNKWTHVAATYDGRGGSDAADGMQVYFNGVLQSLLTVSTDAGYIAMENTVASLKCGWGDSGARYFNGKVDQVAIWDTVLSIDEIKEAVAIRDYNYHSRAANLVSWWDFDNDTLGTDGITDLIGTNHGTMQSGEYADLNTHIPWPYLYQLDSNAAWDSITPMQYGFTDSIFGGFSWDLDGSAEYLELADQNEISFTNDTMYMSAWIQMDDATNFAIIAKASEYEFVVNASDKLQVKYIDASTGGYIGRSYNTALTQWQGQYIYVEAELTGNTSADIDLRINGVSVDDTDFNSGSYTAMENQGNDLLMGYDGTNFANGRITDIVISPDVLTSRYNNHEPEDIIIAGDNVAVHYRAYNSTNTSNSILDQGPNGYNANPVNTDDADFTYSYPREVLDSAGSFDFDGSAELAWITSDMLAHIPSFPAGMSASVADTNTGTICAFIAPDNPSTTEREIFSIGDYSSNSYVTFDIANISGDLRAGCRTAGVNRWFLEGSNASFSDGKWTHVCVVKEPSDQFLYQDGVSLTKNYTFSADKTYWLDDYAPDTINIAMQVWFSAAASAFDGKIAHVMYSHLPLTQAEIQELYNDGSPINPLESTFSQKIVAYWKLDQTDSPTTTDGITDIINGFDATGDNMEAGDLKTDIYPTN